MSGRHVPSGRHEYSSSPFSKRAVLIGVGLIAGVAAAATVVATASAGHGRATAGGDGCTSTVSLKVVTSPSIAASVKAVAGEWLKGHPRADGSCVSVTTTASPDAKSEAGIVDGSSDASLWIPDSSVWVQRLGNDLGQAAVPPAQIQAYPSIASSPLTVVAPAPRVAQAGELTPASILSAAATGAVPLTIADPVTNADGLLGLLAMRSMISPSPGTASAQLMGLMVRLAHQAVPSSADALAAMTSPDAVPVVASEQAAIAANHTKPQPVVGVIYPSGGSLSLDYPVVRLSRGSDGAAVAPAAAAFQRMLRAISAQQVFQAAGFRDPAGDPLEGTNGLGSASFKAIPAPTASDTLTALRAWSAAGIDSHTLTVIDVSGSMADPAGNGQSKIALAADSAASAVSFFPDQSSFGLWSFSGGTGAPTPWTQLVPVAPLGSSVGSVNQRAGLIAAAGHLPTMAGGSTALYDTTLAAFEQIRNTYAAGQINSVVLLTDGQNDYPAGITLDALLSQLRSLTDAAHPVPIITIGLGPDADIPDLRQISAITGGKTYAVANPVDIKDVFLDAMLQRQCRPNCGSTS